MNSLDVLQKCTVEGTIVKLPTGQLDRKLYQEVAKSLNLIGGTWKGGKIGGFVFNEDPTDLLNEIASGEKRNLKKEFQFFATPSELAREMVFNADIKPGESILEPSAGQGAILDEIMKVADESNNVFFCEHMPTNATILNKKYSDISNMFFIHPFNDDFLELINPEQFDKIIANPPFSKNQDIDHIYKMYEVCKKGGTIVTIASKHWLNTSGKKEERFKDWIYNTVQADVNTVEAGTFSESGTKIETVMIIINK